jgi:nucleotide-binding universal stress UspA family protein
MSQRKNGRFHNILIGYDGSPQSQKALEMAMAMANSMDAKLAVMTVTRPPEPATSVELHAVIDDFQERCAGELRKISGAARRNGIGVKTICAVGHPAEQIVRRAEEDHVDLIILGRRGTGTFAKLVLGSVSEQVLKYASCPVLVTT